MSKVELHILQNFPPANLNRDDAGTPKDCEFGGERRARISSQCIKRSIRKHPLFAGTLGQPIADRTKRSAQEVARRLVKAHGLDAEQSHVLAEAIISALVSEVDEKGETNVLYYVSTAELDDLAAAAHEVGEAKPKETQAAVEAWRQVREAEAVQEAVEDDEKKAAAKSVKDAHTTYGKARKTLTKMCGSAVKDFLKENQGRARSVDVALFGRMLADKPELKLDAACQVAHAISTNRVSMEFDYYTAVDDLKQRDDEADLGAGMIGTTGFNSSCFYRYMLIDVDELAATLSDEKAPTEASRALAREGVRAFLEAAIRAIPSGKQNAFAAQTRPSLVMTVVRPDGQMPMSLVNAFERPAEAQNGTSLVTDSIDKLERHWSSMNEMYGDSGYRAFAAVDGGAGATPTLDKDAQVETGLSIPKLIEKTVEALNREVTT